jgi:hypothetical protein
MAAAKRDEAKVLLKAAREAIDIKDYAQGTMNRGLNQILSCEALQSSGGA